MPPLPKTTTKAAGAADLLSCSTKLRRSPRAAESQLHWLIVAFPLLSNATTQHPDNALQVDCCFHVFFGSRIFFRPKSCANYRQQCHRDCRGKIVAPHRMTHCRGELFFFSPPTEPADAICGILILFFSATKLLSRLPSANAVARRERQHRARCVMPLFFDAQLPFFDA